MASRLARRSGGRAGIRYAAGVTTLATETWTGTNGAAWPGQWTTTANGGTADIQSNKGRLLTTATGFVTGPTAYLSGMTAAADMEVVTSFTIPVSDPDQFTIISLRCSSFGASSADPTTGYELVVYHDGSAWLRLANSGTSDITSQTSYLATSAGMVIGVRFQVAGTALKARIWDKAGAEPGTWTITATDATITTAGKVGLSVFNGSASAKGLLWDDLTVTTPTSAGGGGGGGGGGGVLLRNFETGNTSQWEAVEAATPARQVTVVTTPVRSGTYALRMEQSPGDVWSNGSVRAMVASYYAAEDGENVGDDYYYGFSCRWPQAYAYSNLIWELHHRSQIYNINGNLSLAPHAILFRDGDIEYRMMTGAGIWNGSTWTGYENYGDRIKILTGVVTNVWYDIIIHINFQTSPTGTLEIWVRSGSNAWPSTPTISQTNVPTLPWVPAFSNQYFGHTNDPSITTDRFSDLYHEFGNYSGSSSVPSTDVVYLDNWVRASTKAEVLAVFP